MLYARYAGRHDRVLACPPRVRRRAALLRPGLLARRRQAAARRRRTSDHFIDLEKLTFEPHFEKYVRDAFTPVGLMLDFWGEDLPAGKRARFKVVVINDLYSDWTGKVRLQWIKGTDTVAAQEQACTVSSLGSQTVTFRLVSPLRARRLHLDRRAGRRHRKTGPQPPRRQDRPGSLTSGSEFRGWAFRLQAGRTVFRRILPTAEDAGAY